MSQHSKKAVWTQLLAPTLLAYAVVCVLTFIQLEIKSKLDLISYKS